MTLQPGQASFARSISIPKEQDHAEVKGRAAALGLVTERQFAEQLGWTDAKFRHATSSGAVLPTPFFRDKKGNAWWKPEDVAACVKRYHGR